MMALNYVYLFAAVFTVTLAGVNSRRISRKENGLVSQMEISVEAENEAWDYVTVRPKAHMFYWLYYTTHSSGYKNRPLILWLQGGPGGSGTGFGNFGELGPLDVNLKPRKTTWLQTASLLFVDNPVGTGFSYVDDDSAFVKTNDEIAEDMMVLLKGFVKAHPEMAEVPFYIFCESYGGKMTASISAYLYKAVQSKEIRLNFKGLALGDSWISPADSVLSWGPYLFATSIVSKSGLEKIYNEAQGVVKLINEGKFAEATEAWNDLEGTVMEEGSDVNFYNIMDWGSNAKNGLHISRQMAKEKRSAVENLFQHHVQSMVTEDLDTLMNGPIRKKLGIIPKNVEWGGQSHDVFSHLKADFMKNVTSVVNDLINNTTLKVVVYSGQLDLICDVLGTEAWFYRLDVADRFKKAEKQTYACNTDSPVCYLGKKYKNVEFYWILDAGHMVPADNGPAALSMVNRIIG